MTMATCWIKTLLQTLATFLVMYVDDVGSDPYPRDERPAPPDLGLGSKLLASLCSPSACRNGQCYVRGKETLCYCQSWFKGPRCEYVNIDHVSYTVIGSMVIFQWPRPPRLNGYSFVYHELDKPDSGIHKTDIVMERSERAALVGNLRGGYTMYRICIEDKFLAYRAVDENSLEHLSNCINLTTQPDYHTLVFWCIAAMFVCVVVLLIYCQKDKFELLYFSRPVFLMYEPEEEDKTDSESSQRTPHLATAAVVMANHIGSGSHVVQEVTSQHAQEQGRKL